MCGPEFSDLEPAIWQRFQDDDVVVLGVNPGPDPLETLEAFVDAFQITFPILPDEQAVYLQYRQPGPQSPFPLDYVIDQDGLVAYHATEYRPEAMVAVIEDLLGIETSVGETPASGDGVDLTVTPNPFNPRTVVSFELHEAGVVHLDVLDARGRRVRRLLDGEVRDPGPQDIVFDGRDGSGRDLPTGVYVLRLKAGDSLTTRKLTLLR